MSAAIAGIAGSLRAGSHTRALLRAAASHVPPGLRLTIWEALATVPPFSEDLEAASAPGAVAELRQLIGAADAVLIVTPEYNGSVPGQLKNALDWASRPRGAAVLEGKPAAVISASPSPRGGAGALADLRKILFVAGANVAEPGWRCPRSTPGSPPPASSPTRTWPAISPGSSASSPSTPPAARPGSAPQGLPGLRPPDAAPAAGRPAWLSRTAPARSSSHP